MRVGVQVTVDGRPGRQAAWLRHVALTVEGLGFDSLWVGDHIVEFASYRSRHPYRDTGRHPSTDRGLPGRYEPLLTLTAVASWTTTLRIGTAVLLLTERNPVLTAVSLATLDHLSDGRLEVGIGVGWLREEHEALGVPFEDRGRRCDEYIRAMQRLWTDEITTFSGNYVSLSNVLAFPKPVSRPHPTLLIGGSSDSALRRVVRFGNGWMPVFLEGSELRARYEDLCAMALAAGRDIEDLVLMPMYVLDSPEIGAQQREAERHLRECEAAGFDGIILKPRLDEATADRVLASIARLTR